MDMGTGIVAWSTQLEKKDSVEGQRGASPPLPVLPSQSWKWEASTSPRAVGDSCSVIWLPPLLVLQHQMETFLSHSKFGLD